MTVSVTTPPDSFAYTLLATVKTELGITSSTDDDFIQTLIDESTEQIDTWVGRPLYRAKWTETRFGSDSERITLSRYPLITVDSVLYDSSSTSGVIAEDSASGILYYSGTFGTGTGFTNDAPALWSFTYTAGYFLPADDVIGTTISVANSDNSYNDSASGFPTHLKTGDVFYADGFSNAANNGYRVVVTATAAKITVTNTLTTESAGTTFSLFFRNLPGRYERACIELVKMRYSARTRDPSVSSVTIGDASISWSSSSQSAMRDIEKSVRGMGGGF